MTECTPLSLRLRCATPLAPARLWALLANAAQQLARTAQRQGRQGEVILFPAGAHYCLQWKDTPMETNEVTQRSSGYAYSREYICGVPVNIFRSCLDGTIDSIPVLREALEFRITQLQSQRDACLARIAAQASAVQPSSEAERIQERIAEIRYILAFIAAPIPKTDEKERVDA